MHKRGLSFPNCSNLLESKERSKHQLLGLYGRSSSQTFLINGCEIDQMFSKLKDGINVSENLAAITNLSKKQQFFIDSTKFNTILKYANSKNQEISELAQSLFNAIASFSTCFFVSVMTETNVQKLYQLLPNASITKALGKLASSLPSVAKTIVQQPNFDALFEEFSKTERLPLFVWFISCFAGYQELNEVIIPIYEGYIFQFSISEDATLCKHSIDALRVLALQSDECHEFVSNNPILPAIIERTPDNESFLSVYLDFLKVIAEKVNIAGYEEAIEIALNSNDNALITTALGLLDLSIHDGIDLERFTEHLFSIYKSNMNMNIIEMACSTLCNIFSYMTPQVKSKLIEEGFLDVLKQHIDCVGEDGAQALASVYVFAATQSLEEIVDTVETIAIDNDIAYECFTTQA